jgi:hypothetical protein
MKIIKTKIKNCVHCPNKEYNPYLQIVQCKYNHKQIPEIGFLIDCPLEDYQEINKG